jgi:hypothetical protein
MPKYSETQRDCDMTIADVKRELPAVPILVGKRVLYARVSGRLNQFATVTVSHLEHGEGYLRGPAWRDWTFSWEAVTRAVTTGKPLNGND